MISYNRIMSEMERQLQLAKQANEEGKMREALTAIQSLCAIVLEGEVRQVTSESTTVAYQSTRVQPIGEQQLQEKDANGESIFDF